MDKELLEAIGQMMDEKLKPISERLESVQEDINHLKDTQEETRSGVNSLLDWAEDCGNSFRFPLPRIGEKKAQ